MKSDKEGVNSMRLQATGKYIVWEDCKTLLYVVLGLLGIGFFSFPTHRLFQQQRSTQCFRTGHIDFADTYGSRSV